MVVVVCTGWLLVHCDTLISGSEDTTIKVWDTDMRACERTLEGHVGGVPGLVMHGDNTSCSGVWYW
jgi:WD40 repeat protein